MQNSIARDKNDQIMSMESNAEKMQGSLSTCPYTKSILCQDSDYSLSNSSMPDIRHFRCRSFRCIGFLETHVAGVGVRRLLVNCTPETARSQLCPRTTDQEAFTATAFPILSATAKSHLSSQTPWESISMGTIEFVVTLTRANRAKVSAVCTVSSGTWKARLEHA